MALNNRSNRVCIVGGGISGLSTALCAVESNVLRGDQITIIAQNMYDETVSYIAAGFLEPADDIVPDLETGERWYRDSFERYAKLDALQRPRLTGVKKISGYMLSSHNKQRANRLAQRIFPDLQTLTDEELAKFPKKYKYGAYHSSYVADPKIYLKYLEKQLRDSGVQFIQDEVTDLADLAKQYSIVVNCTGLGAKQLANDNRVVPIRGQVVKVRNHPEVPHFVYGDDFYILPGIDWVTLGGTKTYSDSNANVSQRDREYILQGCQELIPSLKQNEEIQDMVGFRPYRSPVRVEAVYQTETNSWIVHNYGHGGQGINLSWGTAREATRLIKQCLSSSLKSQL